MEMNIFLTHLGKDELVDFFSNFSPDDTVERLGEEQVRVMQVLFQNHEHLARARRQRQSNELLL